MTSLHPKHINTGAPFQRASGAWWLQGDTLVPTDHELRLFRYKLTPVEKIAPAAEDGARSWPMRLSPTLYLQVYPEGEHAAVARELLGLPAVVEAPPAAPETLGDPGE